MKKLLLAASALGLAATAAWAQAGGPPPPGAPGAGPGGRMIEMADTNKDGVVTRAEFDAAQAAMFKRMDANSDGTVNRADFQARRDAKGDGPGKGIRHHRGGWERCSPDVNKDGKVTRDEFMHRPAEVFAQHDKNKDGVLSGDELPGKRMGRGGPGGPDGKGMTLADFQKRGAERFAKLDANKDGKITKAEMEAAKPKC